MTTFDIARHNCPAHNGRNNIVRAELARAGEPLSVYKLQLATSLKADKIRAALSALMAAGGVVSVRGPNNVAFYTIWKAPAPKPKPIAGDEFRIAGPITIPQQRWGSSRLG